MFPLPGVFLFPGQLMRLHIFEERYRQMVEDLLDSPGRLVIASVLESERHKVGLEDETPEVLPIAGLGEIAKHDRAEDGRFLIGVFGLSRVRIREAPSDRLYRKVDYDMVHEILATEEEAERLREPLSKAILSRADSLLNLPEGMPTGLLSDVLSQQLELPQSVMEDIYVEGRATRRAEKALAAHAKYPTRRRR